MRRVAVHYATQLQPGGGPMSRMVEFLINLLTGLFGLAVMLILVAVWFLVARLVLRCLL